MNDWMHDEFQQIGTDYASVAEVECYDRRMREFRDVESENAAIFQLCGLKPGQSLLEIGTGTGALARYAAARGVRVRAIDISPVMLEYAAKQCAAEQLDVRFDLAGFLTFSAAPEEFDAVASGLALHHLSDVWKAVALRRIFAALKPGGVFVLQDVIFDWKDETPERYFERIANHAPGNRSNFTRHIAAELSTLTWIMTGLLERAGFNVLSDTRHGDYMHTVQARKPEAKSC